MIDIFYRDGSYNAQCSETDILGGMVATFDGNRSVKKCDDKSVPFGFFRLMQLDTITNKLVFQLQWEYLQLTVALESIKRIFSKKTNTKSMIFFIAAKMAKFQMKTVISETLSSEL